MAAVVGIDLGTTNSVVAVATDRGPVALADSNGSKLLPSIVSFDANGSVLVGALARERRLFDARNTVYSVKRLIGRSFDSAEVRRALERFPFELAPSPSGGVDVIARGHRFALPEISAFVLREARRVAEAALATRCDQAVVTVPANFGELQRSATKAAGKIAGLEILRTLNEPTAAALAYGVGRAPCERVAVFDLGGGTFDVTLLELSGDVFEVLATAGDTFLGGDDIDRVIADAMVESLASRHAYEPGSDPTTEERLRTTAEWVKCQLSSRESVHVTVDAIAHGMFGRAIDLPFTLERARFELLATPVIERAFRVCDDALRTARVTPDQLDRVILVGGSTRMPLVRRLVGEYFGRAPLLDVDPEFVVAKGAAVHAAALVEPLGRSMISVPDDLLIFDLEELDGSPASDDVSHVAAVPPALPGNAGRARTEPPPLPSGVRALPRTTPPVSLETHTAGAPLLVDVTPLSLRIETMGGFSEVVVPRNAPVPLEETRLFTTGHDFQDAVRVRVCQGEARRIAENQVLGELELCGLRPAPRGELLVRVTFALDVDGSLRVEAVDLATGLEQRITIHLVGAIDEVSVATMRDRQEAMLRASA